MSRINTEKCVTKAHRTPPLEGPQFSPVDIDVVAVAGLLHTPDGRYLMQLRDSDRGVRMRGHWGLFGGMVEAGESVDVAIRREIEEELCFEPASCSWFTELSYCLYQVGRRLHRKHFFEIPISNRDVENMVLREGADLKLLHPDELTRALYVVPWDYYGVFLHSRRTVVFDEYYGDGNIFS